MIKGESNFTFTETLDPTHFHCLRYIGPPPKTAVNSDKTAPFYRFEGTGGSFVASLAFTWTPDDSESVLVLPLWMKNFDFLCREENRLKFTKISSNDPVEFTGKLRVEFFGGLQHPTLPFAQILPELLDSKRPLCNGTVLPFCWSGRRFLLRVFGEEMEEGKVFWFNFENGSLDIKTVPFPRIHRNLLKILLNSTWSDEFKVLKHHLINEQLDDREIFLICGVPLQLEIVLLEELGIKFDVFDVSEFIQEEHLQFNFDDENCENSENGENGENSESGENKENRKNGLVFIGQVEKISSTLMTEILRKFSNSKSKLIFTTSARSIETSTQLIQLEKSARRFNFQVNCVASFPVPNESDRMEILQCDVGRIPGIENYKWTMNSMSFVDLMRLERIYKTFRGTFESDEFAFIKSIELLKETEVYNADSCTLLLGKFSGSSYESKFKFYGYKKVRRELGELIKGPLINPEAYDRFGLPKSSGFLLHGPPGCGKSLLCLNLLTSPPFSNLFTIFHVPSASQLLSKYFGETEANLRKLFVRARERKPSIIFIDQIETLGRKRGLEAGSEGGSDANDRYLSTLLNEMDGISGNEGVTIIACANKIELLDEALLRPGRLDRHFFLNFPDAEDRKEIFEGFLGAETDFVDDLVGKSEGWSGAEIKQFCLKK